MTQEEVIALIQKYQDGTCTDEEKAKLEMGYVLYSRKYPTMSFPKDLWARKEAGLKNIIEAEAVFKNKTIPLFERYYLKPIGIAAAVIGMALCVYFFNRDTGVLKQVQDDVAYKNDIGPGGNSATMIVDGKSTPLSEAKTGVVFAANNVKYTDGTEINSPSLPAGGISPQGGERMAVAQVTLVTQRGGMYSTILPDGTKAWLNAASKLEFPSTFENVAQRIVKMKGEVYFEVAKNKKQPFIVVTRGQRTEVLGTHFNVSDYDGEGIRTTLIEGSLRVVSILSPRRGEMSAGQRGEERILKPNQQSLITDNPGITVKQVDASQAIAWKNGLFSFKNASLQTVMSQLARWYDVEVVYEGDPGNSVFTGEIYRNSTAKQALKLLEYTRVKFRIEGKKIIVTP